MIQFALFGIPVGVHWLFWITCVLLGGGFYADGPEDWLRVAVWTAVVFVSIVMHELGHAFAGRRFGIRPVIHLHGLGGVTILPGARFSRRQGILVSAAGPAAGFVLGILVFALAQVMKPEDPLLRMAFVYGLYVNFFWTAVNLLPIVPLDGGQILRDLLGPRRMKITKGIGFACAAGVAIWAALAGRYFLAIMMGFLAWHNLKRQQIEGGVITQ